jgi:formiminotetrahydrofolate cyclodeaminase
MAIFSTMAAMDLIDAFASNEPVPGGGSASALAGAVGTALLIMVAAMPKTRTGAPEETADLAETEARLRPLRNDLTGLIDRDSEVYATVIAARRLPKDTDEQKATRRAAIQAGTVLATEVPLDTMRACRQALEGAVIVAKNGNRNAASDVGVAIELLLAGLRGAGLNVDINLAGLTDQQFVARARAERQALEHDGTADAGTARAALA